MRSPISGAYGLFVCDGGYHSELPLCDGILGVGSWSERLVARRMITSLEAAYELCDASSLVEALVRGRKSLGLQGGAKLRAAANTTSAAGTRSDK